MTLSSGRMITFTTDNVGGPLMLAAMGESSELPLAYRVLDAAGGSSEVSVLCDPNVGMFMTTPISESVASACSPFSGSAVPMSSILSVLPTMGSTVSPISRSLLTPFSGSTGEILIGRGLGAGIFNPLAARSIYDVGVQGTINPIYDVGARGAINALVNPLGVRGAINPLVNPLGLHGAINPFGNPLGVHGAIDPIGNPLGVHGAINPIVNPVGDAINAIANPALRMMVPMMMGPGHTLTSGALGGGGQCMVIGRQDILNANRLVLLKLDTSYAGVDLANADVLQTAVRSARPIWQGNLGQLQPCTRVVVSRNVTTGDARALAEACPCTTVTRCVDQCVCCTVPTVMPTALRSRL